MWGKKKAHPGPAQAQWLIFTNPEELPFYLLLGGCFQSQTLKTTLILLSEMDFDAYVLNSHNSQSVWTQEKAKEVFWPPPVLTWSSYYLEWIGVFFLPLSDWCEKENDMSHKVFHCEPSMVIQLPPFVLLFLFFLFFSTPWYMEFLVQRSAPSCRCNLHHSGGKARSLTPCAWPRNEPHISAL